LPFKQCYKEHCLHWSVSIGIPQSVYVHLNSNRWVVPKCLPKTLPHVGAVCSFILPATPPHSKHLGSTYLALASCLRFWEFSRERAQSGQGRNPREVKTQTHLSAGDEKHWK
jgi:hypothetical protein